MSQKSHKLLKCIEEEAKQYNAEKHNFEWFKIETTSYGIALTVHDKFNNAELKLTFRQIDALQRRFSKITQKHEASEQ